MKVSITGPFFVRAKRYEAQGKLLFITEAGFAFTDCISIGTYPLRLTKTSGHSSLHPAFAHPPSCKRMWWVMLTTSWDTILRQILPNYLSSSGSIPNIGNTLEEVLAFWII